MQNLVSQRKTLAANDKYSNKMIFFFGEKKFDIILNYTFAFVPYLRRRKERQ